MQQARLSQARYVALGIKFVCRALLMLMVVVLILLLVLAGYLYFAYPAQPKDFKGNGFITDVTQLTASQVNREICPTHSQQIIQAISESEGPISVGGARFSQGGQIAYPDSLHIDMRCFNRLVALDVNAKTVTVQAGMRWRDLQSHIDPVNLSVKIMQSYANFTVGGSLSVNAHGRYLGQGPIIQSVVQIELVLADGQWVTASRHENTDLFYAAIGGYGGIGVITEVTLALVDNHKVQRQSHFMLASEYLAYFKQQVELDKQVVFHNANLYPPDYNRLNVVNWRQTALPLTQQNRLVPVQDYAWRPRILAFMADYNGAKWARQWLLDPLLFSSEPVQWRNYEASYDVAELGPIRTTEHLYGLREYFIPESQFDSFVAQFREVMQKYQVNVLNVSVRHAKADTESYLTWARQASFAFVVYYRQGVSELDMQHVQQWSRALIDLTIAHQGTYYLPYQLSASQQQFAAAYPHWSQYWQVKQRVDPQLRMQNHWLQRYMPTK